MTTNTERAGDLIADATIPPGTSIARGVDRSILAAQLLADAGLLMPSLPEPAYEGSTTWCVPGEHEWQTDTYKDKVMLEVDVEEAGNFGTSTVTKTWFMPRDEARSLAYALLAAADYAEQEQENG